MAKGYTLPDPYQVPPHTGTLRVPQQCIFILKSVCDLAGLSKAFQFPIELVSDEQGYNPIRASIATPPRKT